MRVFHIGKFDCDVVAAARFGTTSQKVRLSWNVKGLNDSEHFCV